MKLCIIYNFAAHYRQNIFRLMDDSFDCEWYFGKNNQDIVKMDYSVLKGSITEVDTVRFAGLTFQRKILKLLGEYDRFLMLGDSRSVSTWLFLLFSKFYPRKKVYLWSHGIYGKESKIEMFLKTFIFKLADGIFLYNNYARKLMIKNGFEANKLFVIHNSLNHNEQLQIRGKLKISDVYKAHFGNENPNIVFLGRLTKVKKLDMLLEAIRILKEKGNSFNVTFIGDGVDQEFLKLKVNDWNLEYNVWFYGACYDEWTIANLIYNADLCVAPGNVGLTAIHTMVFGTPVITHNNFERQMPEFEAIIPFKTGNFFDYGNVYSLVEKIEEWFRFNNVHRHDIIEECYKEIDNYWTPEFQIEVLKKHIDLYE
ncbi:glycosyltransferase [Butyricimonas paravirosa]|uniref:glycosyltransferase n=1 Tax=Butyricimonas paravirosa TaxID=1472417 RepID=UPI002A83869A|nr:glycosyltransferase [Butyricimonas paravirosa]